jgi:hypothetical protein
MSSKVAGGLCSNTRRHTNTCICLPQPPTQGTKELVKPVVKPGKKQHTKQRATTSMHVQASLIASTVPTGVSATRKNFPGLDGSGVLLCIVDTGEGVGCVAAATR